MWVVAPWEPNFQLANSVYFLLPFSLEYFSTLANLSSKTFGVSFKESSMLFWGISGGGSFSIDRLSEGVGGVFNSVLSETVAWSCSKRFEEVLTSTGKESSASFWVKSVEGYCSRDGFAEKACRLFNVFSCSVCEFLSMLSFGSSNYWVVGGEESFSVALFWDNKHMCPNNEA